LLSFEKLAEGLFNGLRNNRVGHTINLPLDDKLPSISVTQLSWQWHLHFSCCFA